MTVQQTFSETRRTNCLLFHKTLHNSRCLVLVFDYKVMWISLIFDCLMEKLGLKSEIKTQHLSKVKCLLTLNYFTFLSMGQKPIYSWQDTYIFTFSFSNWSTNLQRKSHENDKKESIMKDGWNFFHRFLESRYKALILKAVQSGESLEFNRFHKIKKCKSANIYIFVFKVICKFDY